jgi:ATP adenylyltransferase
VDSDRLWAPWRLSYVKGEAGASAPSELSLPPGADRECFMCRAAADTADRENLLVRRGRHALTLLNRYPYNNGHLLVAPLAHKARLEDLDDAEQQELLTTMTDMVHLLERLLNAEGFNLGLNLGRAAGAGVPGHLHWHIVPRWQGDTNFMTSAAGARVIPQSLDELWQILHSELAGARS